MSLRFASINSGSNGNSYFVSDGKDAILVDAGLSCREMERRMRRIGISMHQVKAIFISHEHIDHIRGIEGTSRKFSIPVYITEGTLRNTRMKIDEPLIRTFSAHQPVNIGEMSITGFPKRHDAADPHSFIIEGKGDVIGVMTDIGSVCEHVSYYFSKCHAVFLESNYDEEMLRNGRYPVFLQDRIAGDHGHLSNEQALDLFKGFRSPDLRLVLLSHLSQDNNHPEKALQVFEEHKGEVRVEIASRDKESRLFSMHELRTASTLVQGELF